MSCLKLYWPQTLSLFSPTDDDWSDQNDWSNEPSTERDAVILTFPRRGTRGDNGQVSVLTRARMIHANRVCPVCNRMAVVPVDAEPALMSGNNLPVPGTSRLVGFECDCCGHAWKAGS